VSRENYVATVESWRRLLDPMDEEEVQAPNMKKHCAELTAKYRRAQQLVHERAVLQAAKQAVTRELQGILETGRTDASYLRACLRIKHGRDSEKLIRYGIRPARSARGRSRRKNEPAPEE
jgi:hypothetical protein